MSNRIGFFLGPLAFVLTLLFVHPEGMSKEANVVLASTLWIAIWWVLEVLPIAVTSLLPIILFPLSGALGISATTASYGHRFIFLFVGGFMLAIGIEKWQLHKRIALNIIRLIGTSATRIILGFMVATAFLSMWTSNTATTVMMLPIGLAIIAQLRDNPNTAENDNTIFGKALMLAIAYSASIGGMASLIGTPPNLILAGVFQEAYGIELGFSQWLVIGLPISLVLLFICWQYLIRVSFSFEQKTFPGGMTEIKNQLQRLGAISKEERMLLIVFSATVFLWMTRSFLINPWLPALDDTIIALMAAISLFILPASKPGERLLDWRLAVQLPWGVLLLFGAGFAIAEAFGSSGLALWIATQLTAAEGVSPLVLLFLLVASVNFLTEITSNMATTAMLLPILVPVALSLDLHPYMLMIGVTLAASCAFMLPVATAPNAVIFGSGYLRMKNMVRAGVGLNIISIIIITLFVYLLLPIFWDIDPSQFPEELRTSK